MNAINMKTGFRIDAEKCDGCPVREAKACSAIFPGGSWPAEGTGLIPPCSGIVSMPESMDRRLIENLDDALKRRYKENEYERL